MSSNPRVDGTSFRVPSFGAADLYCAVVVALPLLLLQALLWAPFVLLTLPALGACRLYLSTLPRPLRRIGEDSRSFRVLTLVTRILSLPALAVLWAWVLLVWTWSFASSLPFGLVVLGLLQGKWKAIRNNVRLVYRYCDRPGWDWRDLCRGVIGLMDRQGFFELAIGKPPWGIGSLLLQPVIKYALQCNLFLDELELKFANEWIDPPRPDLSIEYLRAFTKKLVCTALHSDPQREFIDKRLAFAAHYPFPRTPGGVVTGMQFGQNSKGLLIVQVIHDPDLDALRAAGRPIRPDDVASCLFHVQLLYTNPFHVLVGDVFVDVTKDLRVEHQMDCAASKSTFLGNRAYETAHLLFATAALRESVDYLDLFGLET